MTSGVALVVVLHPPKVIKSGLDFEQYLHQLTVTAYQLDFNNPSKLPEPPHLKIGSAVYTTANDPNNTIYQRPTRWGRHFIRRPSLSSTSTRRSSTSTPRHRAW